MRSARETRINARVSCDRHQKTLSQRPNWKETSPERKNLFPLFGSDSGRLVLTVDTKQGVKIFLSMVREFAPISDEQSLCEVISVFDVEEGSTPRQFPLRIIITWQNFILKKASLI